MHDRATAAQWFAIRTASGREKSASLLLEHKGYEDFLPVYRTKRQWSDRVKEVEQPLFPGYLFCRFSPENRLPILVTPGVQLIVGYGRIPTPVKEEEIEALRKAVQSGAPAQPWPYLEVGQRVEIRDGSLAGIRGILLHFKNSWRIVLSVELLRRSVAVEVDKAAVKPADRGIESSYSIGAAAAACPAGDDWQAVKHGE